MTLQELGIKYGTDKVSHGFLDFYEKHLSKKKNDTINIMEIGVFYGSSIKMWNDYFVNATIYAADWWTGINGNGSHFGQPKLFTSEALNYPRVKIIDLNQSNRSSIESFIKENNHTKFYFILDDGSHLMRDQQITFDYLWSLVESGGSYIIEDIHSSFEDGYDADATNTTMRMITRFKSIGLLQSVYINEQRCNEIEKEIKEIMLHYENGSGTCVIKKK